MTDVMIIINNAENIGKKNCMVPVSKLVKTTLDILKDKNYIGEFELVEKGVNKWYKITMLGKINKSQAIRPRFSVKSKNIEKWEQRFLPSVNFGILVISTPQGLLTQNEMKKQNIGCRLLAYVY